MLGQGTVAAQGAGGTRLILGATSAAGQWVHNSSSSSGLHTTGAHEGTSGLEGLQLYAQDYTSWHVLALNAGLITCSRRVGQHAALACMPPEPVSDAEGLPVAPKDHRPACRVMLSHMHQWCSASLESTVGVAFAAAPEYRHCRIHSLHTTGDSPSHQQGPMLYQPSGVTVCLTRLPRTP